MGKKLTLLVFLFTCTVAHGQRPVLHIHRSTGAVELLAPTVLDVDGYTIESPSGLLDPEQWMSLTDQGTTGWIEANPRLAQLTELNWEGSSTFDANSAVVLGTPYNGASTLPASEDVSLQIRTTDGAIHDANVFYSGVATVPTITIDRATGTAQLSNPAAFGLTGYSVSSASGVLNPAGLNGLSDQGVEGWHEANPSATLITELNPFSESAFDADTSFELGQIVTLGAKASDIAFDYVAADGVAKGLVNLEGPANDLVLEVNLLSGEGVITHASAAAGSFEISGYSIGSVSGALSSDGWNSLADQGTTGWSETASTAETLAESLTGATLSFSNGTSIPIGGILTGANDLVFEYTTAAGTSTGTIEYVIATGEDCQSIAAARIGGDFDGNGTVNFADFVVLSINFGQEVEGYADGDADCSGNVDFTDFVTLSMNFGQAAAAHAVPEPSGILISLPLGLGLLSFRRRRKTACRGKRVALGGSLMKLGIWTSLIAFCFVSNSTIAHAQDPRVLFHGSGVDPVDGADGDVFDFLAEKLGEDNVVYLQGDMAAADGSDADGFDALIISATLNSGTVRGKYADLELPVLNWEQALMRAQPGEFNLSNGGATPGGQLEIDIVDNTHFITEGLDLGILETTFVPETYSIGRGDVGEGVRVLANLVDVPNDHAIMVAEKGAELLGTGAPGSPAVAPERRVTLFLQDTTFSELTDEGLTLFDRTIDWLLRADREGLIPGDFNEDGEVNIADFQILADNFGTGTTLPQGDFNEDGRVNLVDFGLLKDAFAAGANGAGAAAVPEPDSIWILSIAALAMLWRRSKRKLRPTSCVALLAIAVAVHGASDVQAQRVLFHGSGIEPVDGADADVFDFLVEKLGDDNVSYLQGDMAANDGSDADGFDALIISSTLGSGTVRGKYADAALPVLNWEQALKRAQPGEFNMSNGGATVAGQFEIEIIDNTHYITEELDLGFLETTFVDQTYSIGRGQVGEGVRILANLVDVPNDHAIMVAERGAKLLGDGSAGSPAFAPERRATLFLEDVAFAELTDEGLQLFDRTIDWLLRADLGCPCNPGDFNADGEVNFADFVILSENFGTGTQFNQGDNNFDGVVDLQDFFELRPLLAPPAAAAVPEPHGGLLLVMGCITLLLSRRRRSAS